MEICSWFQLMEPMLEPMLELMLEPMFKLSKRCQIIKHLDYGGGSHKKEIDIMRFTHFDINFVVTYDAHQKPSKCP